MFVGAESRSLSAPRQGCYVLCKLWTDPSTGENATLGNRNIAPLTGCENLTRASSINIAPLPGADCSLFFHIF